MFRCFALSMMIPASVLCAQSEEEWPIHSLERPRPGVIHPGGPTTTRPPADATILFDSNTLSAWRSLRDSTGPAPWQAGRDYMEIVPGTGPLVTKSAFGDAQVHLEWMTPKESILLGQDRGNSGVFLMGLYEVQILDSWENITYADGQAASIYGQFPPLANASLPSGSWQSYDIIFRRPHFNVDGTLKTPARITLFHNGVLVQDNVALLGPTTHRVREPYQSHADRLPLFLQDHGSPIRFRNFWIRPLQPAQ